MALVGQNASASAANRATLFYREGPAISSQTAVGVAGGPKTLPVTGVGLPIVTIVLLVAIVLVARWLRVKPVM
jgi:hypothetical protein